MSISSFIKTSNACVDIHTDIHKARGLLLDNGALVVKKKQNYYGLITPKDIVKKCYRSVIDYVEKKPFISIDSNMDDTLLMMNQKDLQVLPVQERGDFIGLIYKRDILAEKAREVEGYKHFVNRIIHNVGGIIGTIGNFAQALKRNEDDHEKQMFLDRIIKSTQFGGEVTRQFQNFESFSKKKSRVLQEEANLNKLVREVYMLRKMQADLLKIEFIDKIDPDSCTKKVNSTAIKEVVDNLVSNALKFTKEGERVELKTSNLNGVWKLEVLDNGIGIPRAKQKDLFTPYTSSGQKGVRGEHSTGLGLSICKKIVESHHGKIWLKSKKGEGTTFFIEI